MFDTTDRPDPRRAPVYVWSEIYRGSTYGAKHPLAVPRVSSCTDLIRAMGWFDPARAVHAPTASIDDLARYHDRDYLHALQAAEQAQSVSAEVRERYGIGAAGNPVYAEVFRRPATSAGGVMLSARLLKKGGIVHCPGGGTHHGQKARASGFCYLNDPVLGILQWLDMGGERIVYLDLDAHHGDGVQDAFADDDRVLTISLHEAGRWPHSGAAEDRAGGMARNFPVPSGLNDSEMRYLLTESVYPMIRAFRPQAIFLQCGADGLEEDPLAKLALSNNIYWEAVRAVRTLAPRLLITGGGGYNPYTVSRCWAGVWATLNEYPIPDRTTPQAETVLRGLVYNRAAGRNPPEHWFTTLRDSPRDGPVRAGIAALADLFRDEVFA